MFQLSLCLCYCWCSCCFAFGILGLSAVAAVPSADVSNVSGVPAIAGIPALVGVPGFAGVPVSALVGSLKKNTTLEYSTRVVQEGDRRCEKSTLNDLAYLTPLRIPLMNPVFLLLLYCTVLYKKTKRRTSNYWTATIRPIISSTVGLSTIDIVLRHSTRW